MKRILIIIVFYLTCLTAFAQEVISSAGETKTVASYELSWTIGEPIIETVAGTNNLTQGFHQSNLTVTAISYLLIPELEIKVFPNPTQAFVTIKFNELPENTDFLLYDLNGRVLKQAEIYSSETILNLHEYASGSYILKLVQNKNSIQNFKLVKR